MDKPRLLRRRYVPDELVDLKNDVIVSIKDDIIVTKWKTLKPRSDFCSGASCYFIDRGFKISRFFAENGQCVYIYCDIIETVYQKYDNTYIFNDLILDVLIHNDGTVRVLDLRETAEALRDGVISSEQAAYALNSLDSLLDIVYSNKLESLTAHMDGI